MPKKPCPICRSGYLRYVKRQRKFGEVKMVQYRCENCGPVVWDVDRNLYRKGTLGIPEKKRKFADKTVQK